MCCSSGNAPVADVGGVLRDARRRSRRAMLRVALDEARRAARVQAEQVVPDEHLAVAVAAPAPIPIVGIVERRR